MLKVLAIGNSFSQDATAMLETLNDSLYVRNLYIGGCSLERHYNNMISHEAAYSYEMLGLRLFKISLNEALLQREWDVITLQQVSGNSGMPESFYPYLTELLSYIREKCPGAKIMLHRTWNYSRTSTHPHFVNYNSDCDVMWNAIKSTYDTISKREGLDIIPAGDVIKSLYTLPDFDPERGGVSLYRDGFHLSLDYGRYAAALTWSARLTGFVPEVSPAGMDAELCAKIQRTVKEVVG